jgi:hypothetical protein
MDGFYKPEVGQIYKCISSDDLFLVVEASDESRFRCTTECIYSSYTQNIGNIWGGDSIPFAYYTLVC